MIGNRLLPEEYRGVTNIEKESIKVNLSTVIAPLGKHDESMMSLGHEEIFHKSALNSFGQEPKKNLVGASKLRGSL